MTSGNYGVAVQSAYRAKVDQMFLRLNCTELPLVARVAKFSQGKPIRILLKIVNSLYDGWIYAFLLLFLLVQRDWRLLTVASLAVAICFIFYYLTKPLLARIRPCDFAVMQTVQSRCLDRYSFPSGHCMTLTVVGVLVGWHHYAAIPIVLAMVLLLCWARMAVAHHYPSDLIAGIGIGLVVGVPVAVLLL